MNALSTFVLVPLYIYPYPQSAWTPLLNSIAANPSVDFKVIVNPHNGPGSSLNPDYNYTLSIDKLNSYSNVETLGYVYSSYGSRDDSVLQGEISRYLNWTTVNGTYDVHVDGIFLDQAPSDISYYNYLEGLSNFTKSGSAGNGFIINPGSMPDLSFYDFSDYINIFENTLYNWDNMNVLGSLNPTALSQSSAIIYDYDADSDQMASDVATLVQAGIGGCLLTAEGGWFNSWPANWGDFMNGLGIAVNASAGSQLGLQGDFKRPTHSKPVSSVSSTTMRQSSTASTHSTGWVTSVKASSVEALSIMSVSSIKPLSSSSAKLFSSSGAAKLFSSSSSAMPFSSIKTFSSTSIPHSSSAAPSLSSARSSSAIRSTTSSSSTSQVHSSSGSAKPSAKIAARDL